MANPQGQAFEDLRNTISECSRIVRHRWRLSTVGLALVGAAAFWFSQYLPREYTASTLFERRDDLVLQKLVQSNSPFNFDHMKATMALDMTGSRAMARALVGLGLLPADIFTGTNALSERERAALDSVLHRYSLSTGLNLLQSTPSLDTISLRCTANDPTIARKVVIALRDNYVADTRERIHSILTDTRQFFEGEIRRLQTQARSAESDLRSVTAEFPGLDPTDLSGIGQRLELLRTERDGLYQRKAALEADINAREQFLTSGPAAAAFAPADPNAPTPALAGMPLDPITNTPVDTAIEAVQREIVDLVTARRMTLDHPEVKARYARLEALKNLRVALADILPQTPAGPAIAPRFAAPLSEGFREWQSQRMRVDLELASLRQQHEHAKRQYTEADDRLGRFQRIHDQLIAQDEGLRALASKRDESTNAVSVWQTHLAGLERVLVAEAGERGTQFTLLEEPQDAGSPSKPRVASVFVVCSGLGLAAATLLVALAELFDRSFRSVSQITRVLGIPVLECIATMPTPRERRRALVRRLIWTPIVSLLLLALVGSAGLAYTSLVMPGVHAQAMQKVDTLLQSVGIAGVSPQALLAYRGAP